MEVPEPRREPGDAVVHLDLGLFRDAPIAAEQRSSRVVEVHLEKI